MPKKDKFTEYVDYLKNTHGYSDAAARGIVGNLAQESSLDPKANNGSHRGLPQWDKNRWQNFMGYAGTKGKSPDDEYAQLDYIDHELKTSYKGAYNKLKAAKDPGEAAKAFQNEYEVAPGQNDAQRVAYATNGFGGKSVAGTQTSSFKGTPYAAPVATVNPWIPQPDPGKSPFTKAEETAPLGPVYPNKAVVGSDSSTSAGMAKTSARGATPPKSALSKGLDSLGSTIPYVSNIYNAFQKPAAVPQPVYNKGIQLQRVNMDNDRYELNRDYRASTLNADATVDGNSSVAVKQFSKAQKFGNMSKINQTERNENIGISNKETGINAGIAQGNNEMLYNYRTLGAERENAIRAQRSGNLANAADKYVAQQNVKAQYDLEERKLGILENTDEYGTFKRFQERLEREKANKADNPVVRKMGGSLGKYSAGSFMKKLKTVY